jgi:ATP-dependent RNA helicase DeaD
MLDLPDDLSPDLMGHLKTVWVAGQQLNITRDGEAPATPAAGKGGFAKKGGPRRFAEKGDAKKPHRKGPKAA